jgi:glycerol-3-phosphate cytidylyltransferase
MTNKEFAIILTAGTFDLLHIGHINILREAKKLGYYLIVALSTNELVKSHKGHYPVLSYKQRAEALRAIKYVDEVVKQSKLIDIKQFKDLSADLFIIGDDWKNRNDVSGLTWLKKHKKVKFVPYTKELSTTKIKNKIVKTWKVKQ